ncbi:alpha/beta fold hydrolase [Haloechinothrix sp. LS1_15]|uniref:dienelactone hydrolase family protein n=1 Tax=Haloechinothrix sp. LS1_15 TaxID=2652248 RepID=UPI002944ED45|nr:alpha/beta fold hydrolase [Haloechinothrix sp. LS1_15]MDV6014670.1 alpha/beta hydrolase [Haloechinothrix sp. LS1_15]
MTEVLISTPDAQLAGDLVVPDGAVGVVAFVHGSGSSRHSPRNTAVARGLQQHGLATLLFDLLSAEEERADAHTGHYRFDVGLLTTRLRTVVDRVAEYEHTRELPVGLFGASTGAAVALRVAAERPELIAAVVSRGGRPDLAGRPARRVRAPTLLIVGGRDEHVLELNRTVLADLTGVSELHVVPGATHLFPEPGALDEVTERAAAWFCTHLTG